MKRIFCVSLVIWFAAITIGCAGSPAVPVSPRYILPRTPQREEQTPPRSMSDLVELLVYYEALLEEWEAWGDTVKTIIGETP